MGRSFPSRPVVLLHPFVLLSSPRLLLTATQSRGSTRCLNRSSLEESPARATRILLLQAQAKLRVTLPCLPCLREMRMRRGEQHQRCATTITYLEITNTHTYMSHISLSVV